MTQNNKQILFICEASSEIGLGHLIRCSALSSFFIKKKWKTVLISSNIDNKTFKIIGNSFDVCHLNKINNTNFLEKIFIASQLLVIDNYSFSFEKQKTAMKYIKTIIFDDFPHRKLKANYLIDPTLERNPKEYTKFINKKCEVYTGTKYVQMRKSFQKKNIFRQSFDQYKDLPILIYLGGTNNIEIIDKICSIIISLKLKNKINLICNDNEVNILKKLNSTTKVNFFHSLSDLEMYNLIDKSSIAIGASGSSCWERCILGIPSIVIPISNNQESIAFSLNKHNAAILIKLEDIESKLRDAIKEIMFNKINYLQMSKKASSICDGYGSKRLYNILMSNF